MQQTIEERNKTIYDLETKLLVSGREQNTHKEEIKSLTVQLKTAQEQKLTLEGRLEAVTKNMDFFKSGTVLRLGCFSINRGYYMTAQRYEISLRVLKKYFSSERSECGKYFSTREEKLCISKRLSSV